ncbi:MAG TPA: hypothetical protein DEG96_02235 [Candidatus Atribacteria bacterium]|nr:hypothetical protein [Candidatus Atribacteria bacterium]
MKKFFVLLIGLIVIALSIGGCLNLEKIIPFLNQAPVIISDPISTVKENHLYSYQIEAKDPEGDRLTYFLALNPEGMGIDSENGLVTWIPNNNQIGVHQVIIEITDGKHNIQQSFKIEVININDPPQIISYLPSNLNIEINEGDSIKFEIQAYDVDINTALGFQWFLEGKLVSSSSTNENSAQSIWKYSSEYGEYGTKVIKVLVSDGEFTDSFQWKITVKDITPPKKPTLNEVITPTNISPQILSGTKEADSSLWINGTEVIPLNSSTEWSYSYNLSEGVNTISITSCDFVGNESVPLIAEIEYDLNVYVDAGNTSGVEDGTKINPFNTIREGIEAVNSGKSVIVSAGTYNEQLVINKEINLWGAGRDNAFIMGGGIIGNLITIEANNVTISGFTIDGENKANVGIYFNGCSFIIINNNLVRNNYDYGISYTNSVPIIEDNDIENNGYSGIDIGRGGSGIIRNNSILSNQYGIRTWGDSSPEINNNDICNNSNTGIYCRESATPIISYNTISNNSYGVLIDYNSTWGALVNPDLGGGERGSVGENSITGNSIHGVSNEAPHTIKAENNWWGDAAGPKYPGNNSSSGDWAYWSQSDGDIDFDPWLSTAP